MRHLKTLLRLPATQQRPMLNGSALEFAITTDDDVQYATVDAREIVQLDERVGWDRDCIGRLNPLEVLVVLRAIEAQPRVWDG